MVSDSQKNTFYAQQRNIRKDFEIKVLDISNNY